MPSVSNKGLSMPQSPIRKLVPFAENAKKNGVLIDIIFTLMNGISAAAVWNPICHALESTKQRH